MHLIWEAQVNKINILQEDEKFLFSYLRVFFSLFVFGIDFGNSQLPTGDDDELIQLPEQCIVKECLIQEMYGDLPSAHFHSNILIRSRFKTEQPVRTCVWAHKQNG